MSFPLMGEHFYGDSSFLRNSVEIVFKLMNLLTF
jgi:hypothetical protein